jgi:hypothetical protein
MGKQMNDSNLTSNGNGKAATKNGKAPAAVTDLTGVTDSPPAPKAGSRLEGDLVPRSRTANDDVVARRIAYSHPVTGGVDLHQMKLADLLDEIENHDPLAAKHLRSVQQDRIRPQFQRAQDIRREVDDELKALQERSAQLDEGIDKIVAGLSEGRDKVLAPYVARIEKAALAVSEADEKAAALYAKTGATYDPQQPREEPVVRVEPLTKEVVAARLKLPFGQVIKQSAMLPKWLSWVGTSLSGTVFGLSLGLGAGLIQSHDVFVQTKTGPVLALTLIGVALAALGRGWIRLACHQFAESHWLGLSRLRQSAWFVGALGSVSLAAVILVATDREGILKAAAVGSAWSGEGDATPAIVYWIIAAAACIFHVGYSVFEGLANGREDPIANTLIAYIQQDLRDREEKRRADPAVQSAIGGLNRVLWSRAAHVKAVERASEIRSPFDEAIAKAELVRLPFPLEHTEAMKRRVQDALHNLEGLQVECDALLSDFLTSQAKT